MIRSELVRLASRAAVAAALVGGPFFAGGCRDVEKIEIPNVFHRPAERPLADVPVPNGFTFKERGSYFFNRNYRVARLRYNGTPYMEDAIAFFKEQMPLSKWRLVREADPDADGPALVFENDTEEMRIDLERRGGLTRIDIDISPKKV
jgi:hypothetical protein